MSTASAPSSPAPVPTAPAAITIESMVSAARPASAPASAKSAPSPEARVTAPATPATPPANPTAADTDHGTGPDHAPSFEDLVAILEGRETPVETTDPLAQHPDPADAEPAADAAADEDARESDDSDDDPADDDATDLEQETPDADAEAEEEMEAEPLPEKFQKRIDGLTAMKEKFKTQRDELRAKVDELEAQVAEHSGLAPVVLPPTADNPLADLAKESDILAKMAAADQVIAWAAAHPDGGTIVDAAGEEHYFTADQVAQRKLRAERVREIDGPKRLDFVRAHSAATETAREVYPELFQRDSFLAREADAFIANNPGILKNPAWPLFAGDWVIGAGVRHGLFKVVPVAAASTGVKSPASTRPAPSPATAAAPPPAPASSSAPAPAAPPRRPRQAADAQQVDHYAQTGNTEDLIALLERRAA